MNRSVALLGLWLPMLLAAQPATKPAKEHPAVTAYLAYIAAIRAGDEKKVIASIEEVPDDCLPAVAASVRSLIAIEAVKTEMGKRMGPPKLDEEGWNMGQLPDEVLKSIRVGAEQPEGVVLVVKDPQNPNGSEGTAGMMLSKGGHWLVPAAVVFNMEPTPKFVAPSKEELEQIVAISNAITGAAQRVLVRLKAGEFKEPAAVQSAIETEMQRAPG